MADIEDVLRGYRPLGPPADLRGRVVNRRTRSRRAWVLIAASALLALACELLSAREHVALTEALMGPGLSAHDQQVRALAGTLGNDATAVMQAELIVDIDEQETTAP
jgi:hypothetical protein